MERSTETTPRYPSSTNQNLINNNPWRSSYHHGGSVVDPSGLTSYSSPQYPTSSSPQGSSNVGPRPHSQSLERDSNIEQTSTLRSQSYMNAEAYETSVGWRVDILAGMAYLTPMMGLFLLILETKNDFVRIHAYQSLLLAIPIIFVHFLFLSIHSLQTLLFLLDIGAYTWLGYQAYSSADTLERNLLPIIGPVAEQWTGEE